MLIFVTIRQIQATELVQFTDTSRGGDVDFCQVERWAERELRSTISLLVYIFKKAVLRRVRGEIMNFQTVKNRDVFSEPTGTYSRRV